MKPYFAKHLPVDGELKIGEPYWDLNHHFSGIYLYTGKSMFGLDFNKKPTKLFLCNNDIKVGDFIFNFYIHQWAVCDKIFDSSYVDFIARFLYPKYIISNGQPYSAYGSVKSWLKIIGVVSPKATWVKENDIFEEDDFECILNDNSYDYDMCKFWTTHPSMPINICKFKSSSDGTFI